jgi:gliding motility-associated-like protein
VFSGLSSGSYNLTVSQNGCTSAPLLIVINPVPGVEFYDFASAVRVNNTIYNTTANATPLLGGFPGFTAIENQVNPSLGALYLNGVNLGDHNHYSNSLRLTGAEIKTIKNAIGNVCGATMHYRVYRVGEPVLPSFNNVSLSTFIDCTNDTDGVNGPDTYGDGFGPCRSPFYQKLKDYGFDIDLTQRCEGSYKLEVYYSYTGSNCSSSGCDETKYINNGGANFIADFTINPISAPTANSPQEFCSSVNPTIANLTTSSGSNISWYANASGGSTLSSTTSLISGNTYYASQTVLGCESSARVPVVVSIINQPNAGINSNLAICSTTTLTESMLFNALGGFPDAGGTWTPALTGTGVYTYTVSGVSPCANATATVNVSFNNPSAPVVGTITHPTCTSSGSVALSGLPATGNWTITASPGGATISGSGTTTNFGNLLANTTYTFVVTNDSGCSSVASINVDVNAIPTAPSLSITSTDNTSCGNSPCEYNGPVAYINEIMNMPGSTFALPPTPGDNTNAAFQSMFNASGTGQEWIEIYNPNPCAPLNLSCYVIGSHTGSTNTGAFAFPAGTSIPPLGFLKIGAGANVDINLASFSGTPNLVGTGRWHLENGCGYILLANPSGVVVNAVYWSQNNANDLTASTTCGGSFNRTLNIPTVCNPSINPLPAAKDIANIEYAGNFGSTAQGPNNIGKSISRTTDGGSTFAMSVIGGTPQACNAGPSNCTPPFAGSACNGTATVNVATGSGSYSYQWSASANNQITQTATALCAGTHTVVVTDLVSNCQNTISVTINTVSISAPTASVTVQPTCTTPTGTIDITAPALAANEVYEVTGTAPVVAAQTNTTGDFTGLAPGSYNVTVLNTVTGCESTALALTVNPIPANPAAPTASVTVQPTCPSPTGTIVVTAPMSSLIPSNLFISEVTDEDSGSLTYIELFNGTGSPVNLSNYKIKVYNNGNTFTSCDITTLSGTLANNAIYVVSIGSVSNQGGVIPNLTVSSCQGVNTNDNIRLTSNDDVEIDLWGRTDGVNFTPSNSEGYTYRRLASAVKPSTIWNESDWTAIDPQNYTNVGNYSNIVANYEYSIDGVTYQTNPVFSNLTPGSYNVTVKDTATGCISLATVLVVNPIPANPASPTASVTVHPTCTTPTGTIVVTAPTGATIQYSVGGAYQSSGTFSNLTPGSYNVTAQDTATGCISVATVLVVNPIPANPAAPTASVTVQPTCPSPTGTILVSAPIGGNLEYSIDNGVTYQSSTTFSGLAPNTSYTVIVRNSSTGCTSLASSNIIINSVPPSPIVSTVSGCNGASFEVTASVVSGVATYQWYDGSSNLLGTTATIVVTQSGTYEVRATVDLCTTIEFVTIQFLPCSIPKGISPNNDGDNDTWDLSGLNVQKAQIFNRYGVEVYSRTNYTNQWDGRTNSGDELPTATYYYVLSLANGEVKTGWVYINRQQ